MSARSLLLAVNGGSATIKFALFESQSLQCVEAGEIESADPSGLVNQLLARAGKPVAIGHRIVMGGAKLTEHQLLTSEVIAELRRLQRLDPTHLPNELALIDAFSRALPDVPQVACFDSVFHRDLPTVAKMLPIPRKYFDAGIRRFGYHGLSFSFLMEELARLDPQGSKGRVILAHLGSGASLAAVRNGRPVDTSMAFTPTAGLMMGTRSGDLDPGLLVYLAREEKLNADQIDNLVNQKSGLLGVSGTTADVRKLLETRAHDARAAEAIAMFGYSAKKLIGAFAAALGGLDTLVFAGGIGENAAPIRAEICGGLEFLGLQFDAHRNNANSAIISTDSSRVRARVIRTDEEQMIARIVHRIVMNK